LGQRGRQKKWALVASEKICKPKTHGGLGLDDPETLNKVLGEKLWWRWLKESTSPWVKIWKQIGKKGIILECQGLSKAPTFGIKPGRIEQLFINIVSRKLEMETLLGFGRIIGNKNLNCLETNLQISRTILTTKDYSGYMTFGIRIEVRENGEFSIFPHFYPDPKSHVP